MDDEHVDQDDDAKSEDEERELLHFHGVFAVGGFVRHGVYSFR